MRGARLRKAAATRDVRRQEAGWLRDGESVRQFTLRTASEGGPYTRPKAKAKHLPQRTQRSRKEHRENGKAFRFDGEPQDDAERKERSLASLGMTNHESGERQELKVHSWKAKRRQAAALPRRPPRKAAATRVARERSWLGKAGATGAEKNRRKLALSPACLELIGKNTNWAWLR
jgi:hypothetical protein